MSEKRIVLLMAHGGPANLSEIEPFLTGIMGRLPSAETVEMIRERYRLIGGYSPLLEITRQQAAALSAELGGMPVWVGMRHAQPLIREAVTEICREVGFGPNDAEIIAVCMAPQYSHWSIDAYYRALSSAMEEAQCHLPVKKVEGWHDEPLLIAAFSTLVQQALSACSPAEPTRVIFTAHSLPDLPEDDPYPKAVSETAGAIARRLGLTDVSVAYQSRGLRQGRWLGPDAEAVIRQAASDGIRQVVIAPIGFVADHVEILYDVDILYRSIAESVGIRLHRMPSPNATPEFIRALAAVVTRSLSSQE
jgi:ferrochelatase